jgi:nucleotide-binding universal stress UspA family protein
VTPFSKILVAVDFSAHSAKALELAIGLAKTFGARIHLLHAYHLPPLVGMPDEIVIPPDFWTGVRDAAARKLDKSAQKVKAAGVPVETHLVEFAPSDAIVETARKTKADLIVMGTRGLTGFKHALLGSVAERTLRLAPCPVLTVKDEVAS